MALFGVILATALVAVLPGLMLVRALWPRPGEGPSVAGRALLTVVLSLAITILVGVGLGFAPHEENGRGWLQTSATGAPIAELTLVGITVALFLVGWRRGAWSRRRVV